MSLFWRDLASTIGRYFVVAASFLPWAAIHAVLAASGWGSPATRIAALALGFVTAALAWRALDRRARRRRYKAIYLGLDADDLAAIAHHTVRAELLVWTTQAHAEIGAEANIVFGSAAAGTMLRAHMTLPRGGWELQGWSVNRFEKGEFVTIFHIRPAESIPREQVTYALSTAQTETAGAAQLLYVH